MNTGVKIHEVRFIIEPELTQCYVFVQIVSGDDGILGVHGWHHKTFPASKNLIEIMQSKDFLDHLLWSMEAPPD